jgi:hypothetical protein
MLVEKVNPAVRTHPEVLQLHWQIYVKAGKQKVCWSSG